MNQDQPENRNRRHLPRFKLTRVVPHVSDEPGWDTETSSHTVAKAFLALLVLHVIVVAALLVYSSIKKHRATNQPAIAVSPTEPVPRAIPVAADLPENLVPAGRSHVVRAGESPRSIANTYGVTEADLIKLNKLDTVPFQSGMALKIPDNATPPDTVAEVLGTPILPPSPNPLPTPAYQPTEQPFAVTDAPTPVPVPQAIPVEENTPPAPTPRATPVPEAPRAPALTLESTTAPAGGSTHKIQPGDTAYSIARRHGVSVDELLRVNGIKDPTTLKIGLTLKIPGR